MKTLLLIPILFAAAGCGGASGARQMYDGKQLSDDKVAVVKRWKRSVATTRNKLQTNIHAVDRKDTKDATEVAVLPGEHVFTINLEWYRARINTPRGKIKFKCEAGHTYVIMAFVVSPEPSISADIRYWVTDETADKVVWGEKPKIADPFSGNR